MKHLLFVLTALMFVVTAQAKKQKVTIDGTVTNGQTWLYLIVNEDTANAQRITVIDGQFSVKVKVECDAFIRLDVYKKLKDRSPLVLIPDSKHITVSWPDKQISGSQQSQELQTVSKEIRDLSPEGFHIDVFTDNPDARQKAREKEAAIRQQMFAKQMQFTKDFILQNKDKYYCAWIMYTFHNPFKAELEDMVSHMQPSWANHPILLNSPK